MPVTLGQAKSFLKIDSDITEDDDLISNLQARKIMVVQFMTSAFCC